jgi:transposase-like protein
VAKSLLRDLLERGLSPERARLFVIDGAKALRVAIRKVLGPLGALQRCQVHTSAGTSSATCRSGFTRVSIAS